MENIVNVKEKEHKYLVDSVDKRTKWDKEQIVYQWYTENSNTSNTKIKIIIDTNNNLIKYVQVRKCYAQDGINKEVKYLSQEDIHYEELLGIGFICKRRLIHKDVFLDQFIRSNGLCEYLLEIENEGNIEEAEKLGVIPAENVTGLREYMNCNMTISFEKNDLERLCKFIRND